jgi:hypothetical protein
MRRRAVSKALEEVWEWKEKVGREVAKKSWKEKREYYQKGLDEAAKILKSRLMKNPDGSYSFIKA